MIETHFDPVYNAEVIFSVGKIESLKKKYPEFSPSGEDRLQGCVGVVDETKDKETYRSYIVWVERDMDFYTLSHECLHLVRHIFVDRGVEFCDKNDEAIAYYHTFWLKKLWRSLGKHERKKGKNPKKALPKAKS